ncbi:hypothetical protein SAMN04489707_10248 [Paenacidovorax caeni]|uniref:Uncharacterized protein n=1 Tax=Paenacidovorax caeni TaxID=343013 RepID=A0A1I7JB35_9BURK|nr:hypothetical protein [Paenacidovorax caeni]SFU82417.1 hypothetical protein SAMN04489707_10248 [Paenacidovorax caeni]
MRYVIVATSGWLLLVDLQSRQVQPLEQGRPEYYGVSWFPGQKELVLSHSGLNNADLVDINGYAQSERGWLSMGDISSRPFLSAPHQILCAPDGRVICTNTGRNVISVFDFLKPNSFQEEGVGTARWDRLSLAQVTGDHLNSVLLHKDQLFVIAHGHSHGAKLAIFSYPDLSLLSVQKLGKKTGLHNILITNEGQRISCHSESGSVIDLDEESPLWESGVAMYTRGLAVSGDFVIVGESQKTGRDLRRSSLSGLWILDRSNWQAVDYLCLGPYGAVNEVHVLDQGDDAHHGHPFAGLSSLLAKDMRQEISDTRLSSANAAARSRSEWNDYKAVFGSPSIMNDGAKQVSVDQLCLFVKKNKEASELVFTYVLEHCEGAHVSAVLGYCGEGGDCYMAAVLLQSNGKDGILSIWKHDGQAWASLPDIHVPNLPLQGTMQLVTSKDNALLSIDRMEVVSLTAKMLDLERCDRNLGIRWTGGIVRPMEMAV